MKTITISDSNWKILTQMKLDRNFKTIDELISSLVKEETK
jgi:predicted CopG family antitoxin